MPRRYTHVFLILGFCCLLGACGFQLRGTGDNRTVLPADWKNMYLATGNPNSEFSREIISQFAANGVQWSERGVANYSVAVNPERFERRDLSLSSEARAAEFELTMSTRFKVLDADRNVIMEDTKVEVFKRMENDPDNVVGKAEELRLLQGEMRSELAQKVLRRIGFFAINLQSKSQPGTPPGTQSEPPSGTPSDPQPSAQPTTL
jgi:LPS-assembly lipoprotein